MKLKTLKDIECVHGEKACFCKGMKNLTRQEAIKWVKEDIKEQECDSNFEYLSLLQPMIFRWIKRLNITEADLK